MDVQTKKYLRNCVIALFIGLILLGLSFLSLQTRSEIGFIITILSIVCLISIFVDYRPAYKILFITLLIGLSLVGISFVPYSILAYAGIIITVISFFLITAGIFGHVVGTLIGQLIVLFIVSAIASAFKKKD